MRPKKVGTKVWVIPHGYLPQKSSGDLPSHESTCVLNLGSKPATVRLTAYFENRAPVKGFEVVCPPGRTVHIRLDRLRNGDKVGIPAGVPFALKVESNAPLVVQHTRLDSTQPALALMTTIAFPAL
jgi:hypothetical protein